jgi:hypothetical protein
MKPLASIFLLWVISFAVLAEDGAYVVLDDDLSELITDFNADRGKVRLLFIIGPSCGICLRGMADLNDEFIAERQGDNRLSTFAVHVPTLGAEEKHVAPTIQLLDGPRIKHYWDSAGHIGIELQATLDIPYYAWDVWLIYGPDAQWEPGHRPPKPEFWQHQLRGMKVGELLDAEEFAMETLRIVDAIKAVAAKPASQPVDQASPVASVISVEQPRGVMIQQNLLSRGSYSRLKSVQHIESTGTLQVAGKSYPVVTIQDRPDQLKRTITTETGSFVVTADRGKVAFIGEGESPIGQDVERLWLSAFEMDGWLVEWKDKGHKVWKIGMRKESRRLPWILEVEHRNGQTWHVYIDSHTGDAFRQVLQAENGVPLLTVEFDDYQDVGELRMPFEVSVASPDGAIARIKYENIQIDRKQRKSAVTH